MVVGGVVVIEQIFSYPGLAKLMIEAVLIRDMPLVQACAMIFCATYIVLIFIADMATILSNPGYVIPNKEIAVYVRYVTKGGRR